MAVYYKFKTELSLPEIYSIKFIGTYISVDDLKRRVFEQRGIAPNVDFDLRFQNAVTKEVYESDHACIRKNTSLIVDRVDKIRSPVATNLANRQISPPPRQGLYPELNDLSRASSGNNYSIPMAATNMASSPSSFLSSRSPDYSFKIAILGNLGTGKSSILHRFADEAFDPNCRATVGCDLRLKTIEISNKCIQLKLWDTAGQERYRNSIVGTYLRKADGIILCYDITDLDSLASIHEWHEFALKYAPERAKKIMVGNKMDLWNNDSLRQVEQGFVSNVSNHLDIPNLYCSAKDADNIEAVFRTIVSQILEYQTELPTAEVDHGRGFLHSSAQDPTITVQIERKTVIKKKKKQQNCCDV